MHELQLVGFTTDRRGLILQAAGTSSQRFVLPITGQLREVVAGAPDAAAAPAPAEVPARPRSQLAVRDIQARLRAGEPVAEVAAAAGTDEGWIERFAPPVRAEQRQVVERALDAHLRRTRGAPSAVPLRHAVAIALAERGIAFTAAAFAAAWSAHLLGPDRWAVELTYRNRGSRTVRWVFDTATGELTPGDRAASQLGYVADPPPGAGGPVVDGIVGDPQATPIAVEPTPAPAPAEVKAEPPPPTSTDTLGPPASGKAAAPEKAAATKTLSRKAATAGKVASSKGAVAKEAAAGTAAPKKKAAAPKKKAAAKKAAAKKVAPKQVAAEKVAAEKAAPTREVAAPEASVPPEAPARPEPPAPATNGHRSRPEPPPIPGPDAGERAPAAPTAQFRSGAAEPVRANGAGGRDRPLIRRRRQLRAR